MAFRLKTDRLKIRPLSEDDLDLLVEIYGDPEFNRRIHNTTPPGLLEMSYYVQWHNECQRMFGYAMWGVEERESGRLVGDCGFFPYEWQGPEIELAYHFHHSVWGHGYASEAAAACLKYGRKKFDKPIVAVVHKDNLASRRVLEKIGMAPEGEKIVYGIRMMVYRPV